MRETVEMREEREKGEGRGSVNDLNSVICSREEKLISRQTASH
jgi:hypothetical protein